MLKAKIISGLEKVLIDGNFEDYAPIEKITALCGERISFQVLLSYVLPEGERYSHLYRPSLSGALAPYATVREVKSVSAVNNGRCSTDEDYITTRPALLPDILMPLPYRGAVVSTPYALSTLWVEISVPADYKGDAESELTVTLDFVKDFTRKEPYSLSLSLKVEVIAATLPEQKLLFTQWFHSDCLASYYGLKKWSDEHFAVIERFARTARRNGINMILTPLITPPLDNEYDTRDLQLARVAVQDGEYLFDWTDLEKWIEVTDRAGMQYFEIGHFFTQAGAAFATKVMGTVDGEYRRLFSADTPCDNPEYVRFLRAMLVSFLSYMKARGDDGRCYFHISDEPHSWQIDTYIRAKAGVADLLSGYVIMDALSEYAFYENGTVEKPVVVLHCLDEFIEKGAKGIWAYSCCAPSSGYPNRFIAMSLARNRSIAFLLYKFGIEGFLQWGYNFYYNSGSADTVNPFLDTTAGGIFPSGDAFSVYPGAGGEPIESMRLVTFYEAIEDLSAFRLCEELYSREAVINALEEELGGPIKPSTYVNTAAAYQRVRDRINTMIKAKL